MQADESLQRGPAGKGKVERERLTEESRAKERTTEGEEKVRRNHRRLVELQ
jgi:hypothetical protein